jgi:hypothetical protein
VDSHKGRIALMRLSGNRIADRPNNRLQRTALRAAAEPERSAGAEVMSTYCWPNTAERRGGA